MESLDVVIVGAGLSGIGAACHLEDHCPGKTYTLLEGRDAIGGTWDLFRYPGIRSDSDMHTLGFGFKPWKERKSIADGTSIRNYVNETADEYGVRDHIRFQHSLKSAAWSSEDKQWTLEILRKDTNETVHVQCNFLMMCAGYYNYEHGYRPEFEGADDFEGQIIDPQFWPEDLDYTNKRVAVIGSGATAITIVPNMAEDAEHVTMVQRSPTYVVSRPAVDQIAVFLRKIMPEKWAYAITRFKNVQFQRLAYNRTRTKPEKVKEMLLGMVRTELGPDYDIEKHFTPSYNPWDQRLCLIPDSDLFKQISAGTVSVVTDHIDTFTKSGIRMQGGEEVEADIIVTATGLELKVLGGVEFTKDGEKIDFAQTWSYKGMLYSDVPNLIQTFGYINASWTLRADLTSEYACRLLNHMDATNTKVCVPHLREDDMDMPARPWIDDFSSGYMQRTMHLMPRQGDHAPWMNTQNYTADKKMIRKAPLEDGRISFES
jgi:monooxygenase